MNAVHQHKRDGDGDTSHVIDALVAEFFESLWLFGGSGRCGLGGGIHGEKCQ